MRIRTSSMVCALAALLVALFSISAMSPTHASGLAQATAAATSEPYTGPKCADKKIVGMVATDASTIGTALKGLGAKSTSADIYAFMTMVSDARIKYEDMEDPKDDGCAYLVYETMVWFADIGDLGTVLMAAQLNLDSANLNKRADAVLARLQKQTQNVTELIPAS